jgi:anaerobic selenocysteine-containing dehydrogenase
MVYLSTTLNTGHAHGTGERTFILPVLPRDEEPYRTTQESMFNFVRLSDGGRARHSGPRPEVHVLSGLARRVLADRPGPIDWSELRDADAVRRSIAELVPAMEAVETIGETRREFHIPGRVLHEPRFPRPGGRARFHAHGIPEEAAPESGATTTPATGRASDIGAAVSPAAAAAGNGTLRLMTVRSEGQFNTVVYEEEDVYRGQERRDVILVHPSDLERMKLAADTPVRVISEVGEMRASIRPFDIRPGNALMYYPEANVLTSRAVDPTSRTPAFKSTWVRVVAIQESNSQEVDR